MIEWPKEIDVKRGKDYGEVFDLLLDLISKVRQEKSNAKKAMNSEIILTLEKKEKEVLKLLLKDLKNVVNAKEIKEGKFKVDFV